MYRTGCDREEAEKMFESENKRQLEKRSRTQDQIRKSDPLWDKRRSRNCVEFWTNKGLTVEQAESKVKEVMDDIHSKTSKKLKSDPEKYASKYPTKVEYYLKRGFSEEEAKSKISEIQKRFSLKSCIEKHGKVEGMKIWQDRQTKWIDTLNNKTEEEKIEIKRKKVTGSSFSPISQKLFWDIYNLFESKKIKFAELGGEFHLLNENKDWFAYDYVDMERKKCIEFNGDFWHCNPTQYQSDYHHRIKNTSAKDIWDKDSKKSELIKNKGYKILIIWESEYRKSPQQTLDKCIKFINDD